MSYVYAPMRHKVEVGQQWANRFDHIIEIKELLPGKYLRKPDVALIPTEFVRALVISGRLRGQMIDQRAPDYMLGGDGYLLLYRNADGSLTEFGEEREARKVPCCPTCGRPW